MLKILKKLIPASRSYTEWKLEEERILIEKEINERIDGVEKNLNKNVQDIKEYYEKLANISKRENKELLDDVIDQLNKAMQNNRDQLNESIQNDRNQLQFELNNLQKQEEEIKQKVVNLSRTANETVWAAIFNNSIENSAWLKNKTFYPGRWAAGYPFLYVLYRILNEKKPKNILELGLGQTTRLIGQYASSDETVNHQIVEHDSNWFNFFMQDFSLPSNSKPVILDLITQKYLEDDKVYVYDKFEEKFINKKFDLISIDGPFGGFAQVYSRIEVLKIIPNCLKDDFVIIIDDCERNGEINTINKIKEVFESNKIRYCIGYYTGMKDTCVITSESLKFFTSL